MTLANLLKSSPPLHFLKKLNDLKSKSRGSD